jgi:hypothetical protein
MQHNALDYRNQYDNNPPAKMTTGKIVMIAGGAFAVAGVGYLIFNRRKKAKAEEEAAAQANNPYHGFPRAAA